MKYVFLLTLSCLAFFGLTFATDDNQIIDALADLEDEMPANIQELNESFNLTTFSSCEDMTNVLENYIKENFDMMGGYGYGRWGGGIMFAEDVVDKPAMAPTPDVDVAEVGGIALRDESAQNDESDWWNKSTSTSADYSTTNLQVHGVDEADILKSDGDHLYYYNQRLQQILILDSPLDTASSTIDLNDAAVVKKINLPSNFYGSQMYINDDMLVIIAQRYSNIASNSFLDRGNKIDVIVYDVSDVENPKMIKFSDLDGYYTDSRMIDGKLYLVSQVSVNRRWATQGLEKVDDVTLTDEDVLPKAIDISYTKDKADQNLSIGETTFPYRVGVHKPSCDSIYYVLPDKETVKQFGLQPSFTLVRVIDINEPSEEVQTSTAFGSTQTIHMSMDWLYLTNYFWMPYPFRCPPNAMCILPWYDQGANTLIHKFALKDDGDVDYVNSTIIEWEPLSQYSMSEDGDGNFRILTRSRTPQLATHLAILDDNLWVVGSLRNIEPGEEFKASRFIGDKLYLVTYQQTDPLFVVDLENTNDPKIVGKLVIPGYSTYLHPYDVIENDIQYLIGLGLETETNQRWGTVPAGIKIDLYKINYDDVDTAGMVNVEQLFTKTMWSQGSDTEALYNPRMFVWNQERHMLVLPMILQKSAGGEHCNIEYDANWKEINKWCEPSYRYTTTFAGMKAFEVDPVGWIDEKYSYDYTEQLKDDKQVYVDNWNGELYPRQFQNLQFRVGYLGDALFAINNLFAHFAVMGSDNEAFVDFHANEINANGWGKPMPVDDIATIQVDPAVAPTEPAVDY